MNRLSSKYTISGPDPIGFQPENRSFQRLLRRISFVAPDIAFARGR